MCFFAGGDSLVIPAGIQHFIESKKLTLKSRMDEVASKTIRDLKIDLSLGSDAAIEMCHQAIPYILRRRPLLTICCLYKRLTEYLSS
jgi:hypothetical protein